MSGKQSMLQSITSRASSERAPSPSLELGRPQRAIYELMQAGAFTGDVLDVGCGAGEHASMLSAHGLAATGVDDSPSLIARAGKRAHDRGLDAKFFSADLLRLSTLGRTFDSALDAGTIHRFAPAERTAYARSLRSVLAPRARLYVLCFGDHELGYGGPARLTQTELRAAFADGFTVDTIEDARFESLIFPGGANAWLTRLTRL